MALTQIKGSNITDGTVVAADVATDAIINIKVKSDAAIATSKLSGAVTSIASHGLGTSATLAVGTGASQIVQLDGSGNLPAVNGSALTNLNGDNIATGTVAVTKVEAMPYDIGFIGGFDSDMVKEDVAVATYGEMVMARACTIIGESSYVDTAPTGATLIMDIMKNGTTIYASTKPLFAISSNTPTVGVVTTTALVAGDRLTFKITQIGSTEPGEGVRFTLKCKTNTNE